MRSYRVLLLPLLAAMTAGPTDCHAVVIADGDGSGNTTAPQDDPGFANIGARGIGSAIYLGNRWVLTAYHVGPGPVTFGEGTFPHILESAKRVGNPRDYSPISDLLLFQLATEPDLPALHLGCRPRRTNDPIVMIGRGRDRMADPVFWQVTESVGRDDDQWQEVDAAAKATAVGFLTAPSKTIRWGENRLSEVGIAVDAGYGEVVSLRTTFDHGEQSTSNEAQAVVGDSGAGFFYKDGPIWELAGMIHSVDVRENQPGGAGSAIFGSFTYAADLHFYADHLRAIADFEPSLGDFDGDGQLTVTDLDLLQGGLAEGTRSCHLDLDADARVTASDVTTWLTAARSVVGDADLDGRVSFADFLRLAHHYGSDGGWGDGNFDGDSQIGFGDFLLLTSNFASTFAAAESSAAVAVPEPGGDFGVLLFPLLLFLLRVRKELAAPR